MTKSWWQIGGLGVIAECHEMKDPYLKMKNNEISTGDIINEKWALKRKRKKITFGAAKSNGNVTGSIPAISHVSTSPKEKLKKESSSARSSTKEKGNDGAILRIIQLSPMLFLP